MSEKGALRIDKAAHSIMEFKPQGCGMTEVEGYTAFYHEERLYSVRDLAKGTVTLIYADNPYAAIEKASWKYIIFWVIVSHDLNKLQEENGKVCVWKTKENAMKNRDELALTHEKMSVIPFEGYSDKIKIMD